MPSASKLEGLCQACGTTLWDLVQICFEARISDSSDQELAFKYAWGHGEVSAERRLLQFANQNNVRGVLRTWAMWHVFDKDCSSASHTSSRFLVWRLRTPINLNRCHNRRRPPAASSSMRRKKPKLDSLKFECIVTSSLGRPLDTFSSHRSSWLLVYSAAMITPTVMTLKLSSDFWASFYSKRKDVQPMELSKLAEEAFTEPFKPHLPLAITLHQLLFPIGNGKIFIGTDDEPDSIEQLYAGMMDGFERYIGQ
ncbi:hypothetical protein HRG_012770 [Hirsutella rhossiliensis]